MHDAVGQEPPFGLHHAEPNLECPVGRGIRPALRQVYGHLKAHGSSVGGNVPLYKFGEFSELMGFGAVAAFEKKYRR